MKTFFTSGFLLCLLYTSVQAQFAIDTTSYAKADTKDQYFIIGLGVNRHFVRDQGVSPLTYHGPVLNATLEYEAKQKKSYWNVYLNPGIGITTGDGTLASYSQYNFLINFGGGYLRNTDLLKNDAWRLYAGPNLLSMINTRINSNLYNASFTYDYVSSLNAGVRIEYDFGWRKSKSPWLGLKRRQRLITAAFQWNIPIIHAYQRPEYAVIDDFTDGNTSYSGAGDIKVTSYGKIIRLNTSFDLLYHLHNGNLLRFRYAFDGVKIDEGYNVLQAVHHHYSLSLLFKLNHSEQ